MTASADRLVVLEKGEWILNHRRDCALPGYLILSPASAATRFGDLSQQARVELGPLLVQIERVLKEILSPAYFYVGRFGHTAGQPLHFHLVPICDWVVRQFAADPRYEAVRQLAPRSDPAQTDGAEMLLYIWREFCESNSPPPVMGPTVQNVVEQLRRLLSARM